MDTLEVHGLRLGYRRAGHGPPVVFVHGGAQDGLAWTPQLEALADEFTVIAWDEPGAGASDDLPDAFTVADYGNCLGGFIDALGLGPAHVVGLSWGTTVILESFRSHPGSIRSMVLAGAYAGWRGSLGAQEADTRLADIRAAIPADTVDPTLQGLFAGTPPAAAVPLLDAMGGAVRRHSMLTALTAMAQADLSRVLPTITVPTQLVWGALDVRSPIAVAHEFERLIPDATLEVIPACGHLCNLEAPISFNEIVRRFLQRVA